VILKKSQAQGLFLPIVFPPPFSPNLKPPRTLVGILKEDQPIQFIVPCVRRYVPCARRYELSADFKGAIPNNPWPLLFFSEGAKFWQSLTK